MVEDIPKICQIARRVPVTLLLYSEGSAILHFFCLYDTSGWAGWWDRLPLTGLGHFYGRMLIEWADQLWNLERIEVLRERWIYFGVILLLSMIGPLTISFLAMPFYRRAIVEHRLGRQQQLDAEQVGALNPATRSKSELEDG